VRKSNSPKRRVPDQPGWEIEDFDRTPENAIKKRKKCELLNINSIMIPYLISMTIVSKISNGPLSRSYVYSK